MLPHGNTAAFLEQQRKILAEKTGTKIFAFSPLYCPLAVAPDKEYTAAEAKAILTSLRDAVTNGVKNSECAVDGTHSVEYGNITAFFCTVTIPFLDDFRPWCEKNGFEQLAARAPGFCVGFSYGTEQTCDADQSDTNKAESQEPRSQDYGFSCDMKDKRSIREFDTEFAPHRMTVFQFALIDFAPEAPFFDTPVPDENKKSGSPEAVEPLSFKWKIINSVWKAKQKEA